MISPHAPKLDPVPVPAPYRGFRLWIYRRFREVIPEWAVRDLGENIGHIWTWVSRIDNDLTTRVEKLEARQRTTSRTLVILGVAIVVLGLAMLVRGWPLAAGSTPASAEEFHKSGHPARRLPVAHEGFVAEGIIPRGADALEVLPGIVEAGLRGLPEQEGTVAVVGGDRLIHVNGPRLGGTGAPALALLEVDAHAHGDTPEIVAGRLADLPKDEGAGDQSAKPAAEDGTDESAQQGVGKGGGKHGWDREIHELEWWELLLFGPLYMVLWLALAFASFLGVLAAIDFVFGSNVFGFRQPKQRPSAPETSHSKEVAQ